MFTRIFLHSGGLQLINFRYICNFFSFFLSFLFQLSCFVLAGIDILPVCADFWFFEFFWLNVWIKIVSFVLMVNVISFFFLNC